MIQHQILNGHHSKHYKSEFIYKLVDMMKTFPSLVKWSQNCTSVQFFKVSEIEKRVLPSYFRHSNFDSFLRQLHLYNFKQNKQSKDRLLFDHAIFKKGNEKEFIHIQRIKNKKEKESLLKQLENNDILNMIRGNACLDKSSKDILNIMFSYKLIVLQKQKALKQKLNNLQQIIKSNRNPKVKQTMTILEDEIKVQLDSNKKFSKSIDIFLSQTLKEKNKQLQQKKQQFQNIKEKQNFNFQKQYNLTNHNEKGKTKQNSQVQPQGKFDKAIKIDSEVFQQKQNEYKAMKNQNSMEMRNLSDYFFTFKSVGSYELEFNHKNLINQCMPNRRDFSHSKQVKLSQEVNPFISPSMILFNLKDDQDGMYMPLHFYNRSVGSELFQRYNATEQNQHVSMEIEKKQNLQGFKSKSEQFQTSEKPIQTDNNPNIGKQIQDNDDSQISFMNDK